MQAMQRLQPRVKELQRKYKGNRQRLNEEKMKLMREHQVNPLGGCLPLLLQVPIFIALYQVLTAGGGTRYLPDGSALVRAIESQTASFLGMNLACNPNSAGRGIVEVRGDTLDCGSGIAAAIPFFVMVGLMVFTTYYQQRQMQVASGQQQQQMQMLLRIMPLFLGFISLSIPAGVLVYWVTTNVWQMGQQHVMLRAKARAEVEGSRPPAPKPRQDRPPAPKPRPPAPKPRPRPPRRPRPKPTTLSADEVRRLQKGLNRFTERYMEGVGPIVVDGIKGHATARRIATVKYHLGYTGKAQRSATVKPEFVRRMRHPRSPRRSTPAMLTRAAARRAKQRKAAKASAAPRNGVAMFDGRPVAAWLKPYLDWARQNGWKGTLNSGFRDPAYSEKLCISMCGAPSCPGRCAGRASNHAGNTNPAGAVDVSDYVTFGQLMRRCPYSPRIFNALGAQDPVHFSTSGR